MTSSGNRKKLMIPFNKAYLTGKEAHYIYQAVFTGKLSGNGTFTKKCQNWMEQRYGFLKCLLTTSGTDATYTRNRGGALRWRGLRYGEYYANSPKTQAYGCRGCRTGY